MTELEKKSEKALNSALEMDDVLKDDYYFEFKNYMRSKASKKFEKEERLVSRAYGDAWFYVQCLKKGLTKEETAEKMGCKNADECEKHAINAKLIVNFAESNLSEDMSTLVYNLCRSNDALRKMCKRLANDTIGLIDEVGV